MQVSILQIVLAAVVGASGLLVVFWRPQWAAVLVLFMWPVEQLLQVYLPYFAAHGALFNYVVGVLALVAVLIRIVRGNRVSLGMLNASTILIVLIYISWSLGVLISPATEVAREAFTGGMPYIVLLLALLPMLILDIYEFRKLLVVLMLVGAVTAMLIMVNPATSYHSGRLTVDLGMRVGFGSALALGEMGGMIALIAVLYRPEGSTPLMTTMRVITFVTGMGLAIGSGSRGQVLGAAVAGILFFPLAKKMANPRQFFLSVIGFGVTVIGLDLVFKLFVSQQNEKRWDILGMLQDITGRFDMVQELFAAYISSPGHWVFGLGTNAYAIMAHDQYTKYVHNVAAEMLCEHGIVGAVMFGILIALTIKYGKALWVMYRNDPSMRATVAVVLAICAFSLFLALKQGSMSSPAPFYWWLIMAKLYHHEKRVLAEQGGIESEHEPEADSGEPPLDEGPISDPSGDPETQKLVEGYALDY